MQVWAVANQKGGVGKTTTSVSLGGLAAEAGKRVLLLDLDPHGSLSCYFKFNPDFQTSGVYSLFERRHQLDRSAVIKQVSATDYPNISLLPAATSLATLERQSIKNDGMGLTVSKALALLWDDFDIAILDCPPQLGVLMINALAAAQTLLIPVQTEFLALKGLERILHTLEMMSRSRQRDLPFLIVPTMYDRRTQASMGSLRAMRHSYADCVWQGKIPIDTKFRDASKAGVPPNLHCPQTHGVEAYRRLLHSLCSDLPMTTASPSRRAV